MIRVLRRPGSFAKPADLRVRQCNMDLQNTDNFSQRRSYPSAFPPRSTQHHAHAKTRARRRPQGSAPDVPRRARLLGRARARAHLVIWDLVRNGLHRRQRNLPSRCFDARWLPPATALVGRCAAAMPAVIWPGVGGDGRSRGRCSDYPHHASIVNLSALCRAATENLSLCQFTTASPTITATTTRQR